MTILDQNQRKSQPWQINLGAEGIAAAQFARCGFDVSVQYGADKPAYDLVATKAGGLLKVSVKGSQNGVWNLTQLYIKRAAEISGKKADFHGAINLWLDHHASRTVCCLVQFLGVPIDQLPRIYLATPREIALRLRESLEGRGDLALYEGYEWESGADGVETVERLPSNWRFSRERIEELLASQIALTPRQAFPAGIHTSNWAWPSAGSMPLDVQTALAISA